MVDVMIKSLFFVDSLWVEDEVRFPNKVPRWIDIGETFPTIYDTKRISQEKKYNVS